MTGRQQLRHPDQLRIPAGLDASLQVKADPDRNCQETKAVSRMDSHALSRPDKTADAWHDT